jgi:hypothetical protein
LAWTNLYTSAADEDNAWLLEVLRNCVTTVVGIIEPLTKDKTSCPDPVYELLGQVGDSIIQGRVLLRVF